MWGGGCERGMSGTGAIRGQLCPEGRAQCRHWGSLRRELKGEGQRAYAKLRALPGTVVLEGVRGPSSHPRA